MEIRAEMVPKLTDSQESKCIYMIVTHRNKDIRNAYRILWANLFENIYLQILE
jgi:hypothetical protein